MRRRLGTILTTIGTGIVIVAVVVDDSTTAFPGAAALAPVLGTALIVAGCSSRGAPVGLSRLYGARPLVWIGQRSYAIYLWHWPVLVLAGARWGSLSLPTRIGAVGAAVVLAAVSYAVVEDPLRHSAWLRAAAHRSLGVGVALISVVALVASALLLDPPATSGDREAAAVSLPPIDAIPAPTTLQLAAPVGTPTGVAGSGVGVVAAVVDTTTTTTAVPTVLDGLIAAEQQLLAPSLDVFEVPSNLEPSLADVRGDYSTLYDDGCVIEWGEQQPPRCVYGVKTSSATIAVLGDSHAAQWFPALQKIAVRHGFRLLMYTKVGCPPSEQPLRNGVTGDCDAWRDNAVDEIVAARPAIIILTGYHYLPPDGAGDSDEVWRNGLTTTMGALGDLASRVLILGDTPTQSVDVPACLAGNLGAVGSCVTQRSYAVRVGRLLVEQEVAAQFGAAAADTSDWLCTPQSCPVIVGNVLVYRDRNHLTTAAAEFLAPLLDATLMQLVTR